MKKTTQNQTEAPVTEQDQSCCAVRKTERSEQDKHYLIGRLNRIAGQIGGVKRMIDEDRYCEDILVQLSAVGSAVKSLSTYMLEQHMKGCIVPQVKQGNDASVDEILELFRRFMR